MSSDNHTAFLLNRRDYRETSLLLDILTREHGRMDLVSRGGRKRLSFALQPFSPLTIRFSGRGTLKTLVSADQVSIPFALQGRALYSGFYLNELLSRLLHTDDPNSEIFDAYQEALGDLSTGREQQIEPALRKFEFRFLELLGYGIDFHGAINEAVFDPVYVMPLEGVFSEKPDSRAVEVSRSILQALHDSDFSNEDVLRAAKQISRRSLRLLLGDKPLKSRELFRNNS